VATALSVAVTSVLLRHPELDALALHDELKEEFCRAASRARTGEAGEIESSSGGQAAIPARWVRSSRAAW